MVSAEAAEPEEGPLEVKPKELELMVATMRRLGVIECDGIRLGPDPKAAKAAPREAPTEKPETLAERQHRIMFAHTSYRPPLPPARESDVPRAVAQRGSTPVSRDGDQETRPPRASGRARH